MYVGSWKIDDYLTFSANTHRADTGAATDGDGVPTYRIYEDETGTPLLTGSMAKLDDANTTGFYSERIQLIAASGFEQGKSYTIYVEVTVNSVVGTMSHSFQIKAEVSLDGHTAQTGDSYDVVNHADHGNAKLVRSTTPANKLDISNTGEAGLDFDNIKDASGAKTLTNITVPTVTITGTASTVTNGAKSAELAKVPKSDSNVVWNATAQTTIQTKAAAALTVYNPPTDTEMLAAHSTTDGLIGGLNNISAVQVNAEVDAALNTAIPGVPTDHSINERVKAIDDKLPAGSIGDATEAKEDTIITKTTNIPASPATEAKQNTLITDVDNNETKIDDVKTQIGTAGAGLTNVGMFSQANTELSAIPATTSSLKAMIQFLFEYFRNKKTVTATTETLFKEDASTNLGTATVDKTATTFTRGEMS